MSFGCRRHKGEIMMTDTKYQIQKLVYEIGDDDDDEKEDT